MAIVFGTFPNGINLGFIYFDSRSGAQLRYIGGNSSSILSWVIVGGALEEDPSTTGWTTRQDGAIWFNKTLNVFRSWDGGAVVTVGGGSSGSVQRWIYQFSGTDISTAFGGGGQAYFVAPAAGIITKWATIVGSTALPEDTILQFYFDPFVAFTLVDSVTLLTGASNVKGERVISQAVVAGDIVLVFVANSYNPTVHTVVIDGFVDFTPS